MEKFNGRIMAVFPGTYDAATDISWMPSISAEFSGSRLPRPRIRLVTHVRSCVVVLVLAGLLAVGATRAGHATDLAYRLLQPSFGGTDPAPYTYAQYEYNQKKAQQAAAAQVQAKAAAAQNNAAASSPSQEFANSIISQLTSLVARNVALQIANASPGQAGTIQAQGASITYVNADGQLSVSITTATGTTSFSVPSIN
jgi:hypothetical protein